jgi:serine/threonine-protein kinase
LQTDAVLLARHRFAPFLPASGEFLHAKIRYSGLVGQDLTGRVLDAKYRIERKIGEGSMGAVWAARQVPLDRQVVVKVLHAPFVGDPEAVRRFQQEAIAAGRVGSPHIVEILDLGRTPEGAPYLAMEYLRGRELSELLREQPVLPPARAADIVCQVLRGVGAAHVQGIIHRDLKPENVFLVARPDGHELVKLVDFGLAKIETDAPAAQLTRTGMVLGTPHTMSPEQVMGRKDVDASADVWSAGVLLFRLLAGRYPHEATQLTELLTEIVTVGESAIDTVLLVSAA